MNCCRPTGAWDILDVPFLASQCRCSIRKQPWTESYFRVLIREFDTVIIERPAETEGSERREHREVNERMAQVIEELGIHGVDGSSPIPVRDIGRRRILLVGLLRGQG